MGTQDPRFGHGRDRFRVAVATADFDFHDMELDDPKPTGRQLLRAAGCRPPDEHLIFQVLDDGALDERRLDETVELRESGTERFIAFRSDRSFRVEIDDRRFEWGDEELTGLIAKQLVGADLECTGVWLERRREADLFIQDSDVVRLGADGVERLRISPVYLLNIEDREYRWPEPTIVTEEIAELGGWDPAAGVQRIDPTAQTARTLNPGEVVDLRKIKTFGKKIGWCRG